MRKQATEEAREWPKGVLGNVGKGGVVEEEMDGGKGRRTGEEAAEEAVTLVS